MHGRNQRGTTRFNEHCMHYGDAVSSWIGARSPHVHTDMTRFGRNVGMCTYIMVSQDVCVGRGRGGSRTEGCEDNHYFFLSSHWAAKRDHAPSTPQHGMAHRHTLFLNEGINDDGKKKVHTDILSHCVCAARRQSHAPALNGWWSD